MRWLSEVLRQAAARGQLAAPLAQVGEAQDRIDEIVVGGRAPARRRRPRGTPRAARPRAAPPRRRSACGSRGRGCRRTAARRSRRPASTSRPRSGSSISSGSYSRTATTSWRCARCASGSAQPGVLMKSDTTNTSERRGMTRQAGLQQVAAGWSPRAWRRSGRVSIRCRMCSTWRRPLRAGITVSTPSP